MSFSSGTYTLPAGYRIPVVADLSLLGTAWSQSTMLDIETAFTAVGMGTVWANESHAGWVLTSNGAGSAPSWQAPTGGSGVSGVGPPGMDGEDGFDWVVPGPTGAAGAAGATGATGAVGTPIPGIDGDDGDMWYIPGPTGATGATGASGAAGGASMPPGLDADDPWDYAPLPVQDDRIGRGGRYEFDIRDLDRNITLPANYSMVVTKYFNASTFSITLEAGADMLVY